MKALAKKNSFETPDAVSSSAISHHLAYRAITLDP